MEIKQCNEFYYRVKFGESLNTISQDFNTCEQNIKRNNNAINLYAGEWIIIKQNEFVSYHVKPTETLEQIAQKHNVQIEKLIKDNNLTTNKLYIGQTLKIYK